MSIDSVAIVKEVLSFGFKPVLISTIIDKGIGKAPLEKSWVEKYSTITQPELLKQVNNRKCDNVGILCGKHSNIIVIDVDIQDNGIDNWIKICEENGISEPEDFDTPIVRTGSRGFHYYFQYSDEFENSKGKLSDGIDILSTGKQCIFPGSVYPGCVPLENTDKKHKCGSKGFDDCMFRGNEYEWIKSPQEFPISEMPDWLKIKCIKPVKNSVCVKDVKTKTAINSSCQIIFSNENEEDHELALIYNCINKFSNRAENYDQWRDTIWCLKSLGFDRVIAHNFSKLSKKYDSESVDKIWDNFDNRVTWNWGTIRNWLKEELKEDEYKEFCKTYFNNVEFEYRLYDSDYGLSLLFSEMYKNNLIITDEDGNGYLWQEDKKLYIEYTHKYLSQLISKSLEPIANKYIKIYETKLKDLKSSDNNQLCKIIDMKLISLKTIRKYILSTKGCKNIYPKVVCELLNKEFVKLINNDPLHLPIKNGKIINLKTAEVRERNTSDYFSFECPVSYNTNDRSFVYNYIKSICVNDIPYTNFIIKFLGYLLTRETSDRSLYILWGKGMNGKSKLLELIETILGNNLFTSCSADVLLKTERKGGATPELIPLINARVAVLNETDENEKLNSERIKKLTGDDLITARALFKNEITFKPRAKLLLTTNKKPIFDVSDKAMTDRIKLLPFLACFQNTLENRNYLDEIRSKYLDDLFSLIIDGGVEWWKDKDLTLPKIAENETNKYFFENDTITQWITECCELGNSEDHKEQPSVLFDTYTQWCISNNYKKESKQKFGEILVSKLGDKKQVSINKKQVWFYLGIKIL
jgi:P4 family phage/plasmid primase-like protien